MFFKIKAIFRILSVLFFALNAALSNAQPTRYQLDVNASRVGFTFDLGGAPQKGTMPVEQANLVIDPQNLVASKVDVLVNVQKAHTGLIFATGALKAPSVLNAAQFPTIRFVSTKISLGPNKRLSGGAKIDGKITLRGVTRPISFHASLYRIQGSAPDDLSQLVIRLTGNIQRSQFGATGYGELVGDVIRLDILAHITAQP